MRLIKNEILKNMSLIKLAIIVFFMIIISFTVIESSFTYSMEYEMLGKSTIEKSRLEEQEKKYNEESTNDNLYFVYLYKLNTKIEDIQNSITIYSLSWQKKIISMLKAMNNDIAILQMISDGISPSTFNLGNLYKDYSLDQIKNELEIKNSEQEKYINLIVNGTYDDFVSFEIKELKEEINNLSDEDSKIKLNNELIKIKQYIVESKIKDEQNFRVEAQKKLEQLVEQKDYNVMTKDEYQKNYTARKTYGEYEDYLYHIKAKEKRIEKEYQRLWYAMENGIELSNSTKNVVDEFWQLSFILTFGIVILYSTILSKEYKAGSIRLLLTQGVKRYKILLSKYAAIILSTYALYLIFLLIYLFIASLKGSFNDLLTSEIITVFNKPVEINYILYLIKEILISGLPTIFIITLVFLISLIRENAILSSIIGIILSLSTLFVEFILIFIIMLKWGFLKYLPTSYLNLPSFKYSSYFLDNNSPLFHILDYNFGIVILLVSIIIMYIISHLIFINKDVRN